MISGGKDILIVKDELCSHSGSKATCEQTVDANAAALQNDALEEAVKNICFRDVYNAVNENTSQCVVDLFNGKNAVTHGLAKTMTGARGATRYFDLTNLFPSPDSPIGKTLADAATKAVAPPTYPPSSVPATPASSPTAPVDEKTAFTTVLGMVDATAQAELNRVGGPAGICSNEKDNVAIKAQCDAILSSYLKQLHDTYVDSKDAAGKSNGKAIMSKNLGFPNDGTLPDNKTKYQTFTIKDAKGTQKSVTKFIEVSREMESLIGINTCAYQSNSAIENCKKLNDLPTAATLRADAENPNAKAKDKVREINKKVRQAAVAAGRPELEEEFFADPSKGIQVTTSTGGTGLGSSTTQTLTLADVEEGIVRAISGKDFDARVGTWIPVTAIGIGATKRGKGKLRDTVGPLAVSLSFAKYISVSKNSAIQAGVSFVLADGKPRYNDKSQVDPTDKTGDFLIVGVYIQFIQELHRNWALYEQISVSDYNTLGAVGVAGYDMQNTHVLGVSGAVGVKLHPQTMGAWYLYTQLEVPYTNIPPLNKQSVGGNREDVFTLATMSNRLPVIWSGGLGRDFDLGL